MTGASAPTTHTLDRHVGEVRLRICAADLRGVFEEAARALALVIAGDAAEQDGGRQEAVVVRARDREALLVEWLNELVYRSEAHNRAYCAVHVDAVTDHELRASIRGVELHTPRLGVKAATDYGVSIREEQGRLVAAVTLDV